MSQNPAAPPPPTVEVIPAPAGATAPAAGTGQAADKGTAEKASDGAKAGNGGKQSGTASGGKGAFNSGASGSGGPLPANGAIPMQQFSYLAPAYIPPYGPPNIPPLGYAAPPRRPVWPHTIADEQKLRQSFAISPNKNYGGTRGDSAALNWALAVLEIGGAVAVIVFSYRFLEAYGDFKGKSVQNFTKAYYCCQFLLGLSILTTALLTLYVLWVFADGRHPMRKAWMVMGQERGGELQGGHMDAGFSGGVRDAEGKEVKRPGLGTTSFETINRFTTNRLFAERTHITKMLVLYALLFVAWFVPFMIVTLANGYVTYRRNRKNHNVNIAEICGVKNTSKICWHLAKAGITAGAVTALLLMNMIATAIALTARPVFSTIPQNGPLSQYTRPR